MSAFTARPRTCTRLFAAATLALAALSLTACGDTQAVRDEGAAAPSSSTTLAPAQSPAQSPAPSPSQTDQPAPPAAPAKSTQSGGSSGSSSGGNGGSGGGTVAGGSDSNASETSVTCTAANTKMTAQSVENPVNHMLLTVTNTGSKVCDLYYYPAVQFQYGQSVPPVIEESQPQAVTSLAPGESGYAGVVLSAGDGSGSNGYTAKTLSVYFFDRNNNSIGRAATPALPAGGVYIDDSIRVTYWLSDPQDALTY